MMKRYIFLSDEGATITPNNGEIDNLQVIGFASGSTPEEAFEELKKENKWLQDSGFNELRCYEVGKFEGYFNLNSVM